MKYADWFVEFRAEYGIYRNAAEVAALDPQEEFILLEYENGNDPKTAVSSYLSY